MNDSATPIYTEHVDHYHGWTEVGRGELVRLGIADVVSGISCQCGDRAYLEEDCDALEWDVAKQRHGEADTLQERFDHPSPIRALRQVSAPDAY